jgi:hypothetical protein
MINNIKIKLSKASSDKWECKKSRLICNNFKLWFLVLRVFGWVGHILQAFPRDVADIISSAFFPLFTSESRGLLSTDPWLRHLWNSIPLTPQSHNFSCNIINSMELSTIREATSCEATRQPSNISWNPEIHHRIHKSSPLFPILSQITPVQTTPSYLSKIHLNIINSPLSWSS